MRAPLYPSTLIISPRVSCLEGSIPPNLIFGLVVSSSLAHCIHIRQIRPGCINHISVDNSGTYAMVIGYWLLVMVGVLEEDR